MRITVKNFTFEKIQMRFTFENPNFKCELSREFHTSFLTCKLGENHSWKNSTVIHIWKFHIWDKRHFFKCDFLTCENFTCGIVFRKWKIKINCIDLYIQINWKSLYNFRFYILDEYLWHHLIIFQLLSDCHNHDTYCLRELFHPIHLLRFYI